MADRVLAFNGIVGGIILLFAATMAIVGGRRYRSKPDQVATDSTPNLLKHYYEINNRWKRSAAYFAWLIVFACLLAVLAIYFFWIAWRSLSA